MSAYFSKYIYSLAILAIVTSGCITTRYQAGGNCPVQLMATDQLLVPYIQPLPLASSADYFHALAKKFSKQGIAVKYLPEEEWTFKAAGIANPLHPQHYDTLLNRGYTYFLLIEVVDEKAGLSSVHYYTQSEIDLRNDPYRPNTYHPIDEMAHKVKLRLYLFSLKQKETVYSVNVKTTISSFVKRNRNGGETQINLGNTGLATRVAIKKGAKKVLKKCR